MGGRHGIRHESAERAGEVNFIAHVRDKWGAATRREQTCRGSGGEVGRSGPDCEKIAMF